MSEEETTEARSDDGEAIDWPLLATEDGFRRCRRVFLGLVLTLLSIRLGSDEISVDLIPDWAGWWLVASALAGWREVHARIPGLVTLARASCALAFVGWISLPRLAAEPIFLVGGTVFGIVTTVVLCLFVWNFCAVVVRAAGDTEEERLRERADLCRRIALVSLVVAWLLPIPLHFGETLHPVTVIAVFALGLFAYAYFLVIVWAFGTLIRRVLDAMAARESSA